MAHFAKVHKTTKEVLQVVVIGNDVVDPETTGTDDESLGQAFLTEHFGAGTNKNNLTEQQTYEWQTRGLVNWEFYRTDAAFAAAFRDQFPDVDGKTATGLDNEAGITSVGEIRELLPSVYQEMITRSQGKDAWRSTWDG